jgi:hypothetical protein
MELEYQVFGQVLLVAPNDPANTHVRQSEFVSAVKSELD